MYYFFSFQLIEAPLVEKSLTLFMSCFSVCVQVPVQLISDDF